MCRPFGPYEVGAGREPRALRPGLLPVGPPGLFFSRTANRCGFGDRSSLGFRLVRGEWPRGWAVGAERSRGCKPPDLKLRLASEAVFA
jgi:hypothetical protein